VGNEQRVLVSELSGRQNIMNIMSNIEEAGILLGEKAQASERALAILNRVKAWKILDIPLEVQMHLFI
jgi:hypothetical protein